MKGRDRGNFLALSQLIKTYKHVISSDVIAHSVKQIEQKKNEMKWCTKTSGRRKEMKKMGRIIFSKTL